MSIDTIRKSPTGRYLTGITPQSLLSFGYHYEAGPANVPDATDVLLAQATTDWPTDLTVPNARVGIIAHTTVTQGTTPVQLADAQVNLCFSAALGTNIKRSLTVRPISTASRTAALQHGAMFLSAQGDGDLSIDMPLSVQAVAPGNPNPQHIYLGTHLWWFVTGPVTP